MQSLFIADRRSCGVGVPAAEGEFCRAYMACCRVLDPEGAGFAGQQRDIVVGVVCGQDPGVVFCGEQGELVG